MLNKMEKSRIQVFGGFAYLSSLMVLYRATIQVAALLRVSFFGCTDHGLA